MLRKKKAEASGETDYSLDVSGQNQEPKKPSFWKRHRKAIIALICIVVVIALVAALLPKPGAQPTAASTSYVEAQPQTQSITNTFSGDGTITAANSYNVTSLVSGTVLTANFEVGDVVQEGDVLYTIDSSDADTQLEQSQLSLEQAQRNYNDAVDAQYIRTDIAGTVSGLTVRVGDLVTAGQQIATVRDDSTMLLTLEFPAADAANFAVGQAASVILDSTFETVGGTVQSVAGTDTLSSGNMLVRTVTIAVPNAGSLTTAQAAAASINGVSSLASARFTYSREEAITASAAGKVAAVNAQDGSSVGADAAIVQLTSDALTKQIQSSSDSLRNAQISLENVQKQLDNYTITAPIGGTIVQKNVKAGEKISAGTSTTTLCTIYDISYLEITLNVDELEIRSIQEGQSATITADAVSERTYSGTVTSVLMAGTTSGGTTTYPVTVRIDDTEDLMPGMNATVEITVASAENALTVPNGAVVRGSYVMVTSSSPSAANAVSDMTAPDGYVYVKVETGVSDNDNIEITSGLTAEDTIAYDADAAAKAAESTTDQWGNMPGGGGPGGGGAPGGGGPGGGF